MAILTKRFAIVSFVGAWLGCDGSLAPGTYRGETLFQIDGIITDLRAGLNDDFALRASLFWADGTMLTTDPHELEEQPSVDVQVEFPATFHFNIFDEPPASPNQPYRLGQILVFHDRNSDGAMSMGEAVGGSTLHQLIYAWEPLEAESSPIKRRLPAGLSVVPVPLPCELMPPTPASSRTDCGVPLGSPCSIDADCGADGWCLDFSESLSEFGLGYCVLPEDFPCVPRDAVQMDAVLFFDPRNEEEWVRVWVDACDTDADCRKGQHCAGWAGACLAKSPVYLEIFEDEYHPLPLCR